VSAQKDTTRYLTLWSATALADVVYRTPAADTALRAVHRIEHLELSLSVLMKH
jgi:hypothetical protein